MLTTNGSFTLVYTASVLLPAFNSFVSTFVCLVNGFVLLPAFFPVVSCVRNSPSSNVMSELIPTMNFVDSDMLIYSQVCKALADSL